MNNDVTISIKANTSEFEAAMARATEAAANFRKALKSLPWYIRWMMGLQHLLEKLKSQDNLYDLACCKSGTCRDVSPPAKWSTRYFHVGANADETGKMDSRPDPRKRPYIPCSRAKE